MVGCKSRSSHGTRCACVHAPSGPQREQPDRWFSECSLILDLCSAKSRIMKVKTMEWGAASLDDGAILGEQVAFEFGLDHVIHILSNKAI